MISTMFTNIVSGYVKLDGSNFYTNYFSYNYSDISEKLIYSCMIPGMYFIQHSL